MTRTPTGPYRRLNPTTKLVIALCEAAIAFGIAGWTGPVVALGLVLAAIWRARLGRQLRPFLLAVLPLVASIVLVNTFLYPGATDVAARVGPLTATWTGLVVALQAMLRVLAFALSVAVLVLTTDPDDLVADLERRGLGRRGSYLVGSTLRTIPSFIERAREITAAQRSRGLDTEAGIGGRLRGVLPLAGPLIFGALTDVEERTMALEARAFSAPGRRTVLRRLPDTTAQRVLRWALPVAVALAVGASVTRTVTPP